MRALLILLFLVGSLSAESKIALLIGNSNYMKKRLDNPKNDVDLLESKLKEIGFTVYNKKDLSKSQMISELKKFYQKIDKETIALIYFSGHGVNSTLDQKNYLIPIGAFSALFNEGQLPDLAISDNYLLNSTAGAKFSILLLDACRSNDFKKVRGDKGLGQPNTNLQNDYIISYATEVGKTAEDGDINSPYALALSKYITSSYSITDMFTKIRNEVSYTTHGEQKPFYISRSNSIFYLTQQKPLTAHINTDSKELQICKYLSYEDKDVNGVLDKKALEACSKVKGIIGKGYMAKALYRLKRKKEAKKIFSTIEEELKDKCQSNVSDACYLIAVDAYNNNKFDKSIEFESKACHLGNGRACYTSGYDYSKGKGISQDYAKAREFYQKAIELGYSKAYISLGYMYEKGKGVRRNESKAIELYGKACNLNNGNGCYNLGQTYLEGLGVIQNYSKAIELYKKSCELDYGFGCNGLALMYEYGKGTSIDYKKAKIYYEKAITLSCAWGYNNLGLFYKQGRGASKNYDKARELFKTGCTLENGTSCNNLALLYDKGLGITKDNSLAIKYYTKACELNNGWGCNNIASYYRKGEHFKKDYDKAFTFYKKACELNNGAGCTTLGYMYEMGQGTKKDIQQALKLYKKACKLKSSNGCTNLGHIYKNGNYVNKDLATAKKFYKKGCDLDNKEACTKLSEI